MVHRKGTENIGLLFSINYESWIKRSGIRGIIGKRKQDFKCCCDIIHDSAKIYNCCENLTTNYCLWNEVYMIDWGWWIRLSIERFLRSFLSFFRSIQKSSTPSAWTASRWSTTTSCRPWDRKRFRCSASTCSRNFASFQRSQERREMRITRTATTSRVIRFDSIKTSFTQKRNLPYSFT